MKPTADTFFYIHPKDAHGGIFILRNDEFKHAVKVLRIKEGDIIAAVNGEGTEYLGEITEISGANKSIRCREIRKRRMTGEPMTDVTLLQAPVKGDRTDYLIEKAVEIGVNRVIPVQTTRTIIKVSANRTERWKRIALAGMKQSGRSVWPEIADALSWEDAITENYGNAQKLILQLDGEQTLSELLEKKAGPVTQSYIVAIGPEGDFTENELEMAKENGFTTVTLGPRRMRAETAGLVALSRIIAGQ